MNKFFSVSLFLHVTLAALLLSHFHTPHQEKDHKSYVTISLSRASKVTPPKFKKIKKRERKKMLDKKTSKEKTTKTEDLAQSNLTEQIQTEKLEYKDELYHFLKNKNHYPPVAAKLKQSGKVKVKIQINKNGEFRQVLLVEPSKFKTLNQGTLSFLNKVAKFKPLPEHLNSEIFEVPIVYEL